MQPTAAQLGLATGLVVLVFQVVRTASQDLGSVKQVQVGRKTLRHHQPACSEEWHVLYQLQ